MCVRLSSIWYTSEGVSLFAHNSMCARIGFKNPIQYRCTYRSSVILVYLLYLKVPSSPSSRRRQRMLAAFKSQVGQDWAHLLYLVAGSTYWQSLWLYLELLLNFEYRENTHKKTTFVFIWLEVIFRLNLLEAILKILHYPKKSCRLFVFP